MFKAFIEKLKQIIKKLVAKCSCKKCTSSNEAKHKDDPSNYDPICWE